MERKQDAPVAGDILKTDIRRESRDDPLLARPIDGPDGQAGATFGGGEPYLLAVGRPGEAAGGIEAAGNGPYIAGEVHQGDRARRIVEKRVVQEGNGIAARRHPDGFHIAAGEPRPVQDAPYGIFDLRAFVLDANHGQFGAIRRPIGRRHVLGAPERPAAGERHPREAPDHSMLGAAGGGAQRQVALGGDCEQHGIGVPQWVRLGAAGARGIQLKVVEVPRRGVNYGVAVGSKSRGRDDAAAKGQSLESGRRGGAKTGQGEERAGREDRCRRDSKKRTAETVGRGVRAGMLQRRLEREGQIAGRLEAVVGVLRQAPPEDAVQGCRVWDAGDVGWQIGRFPVQDGVGLFDPRLP